MHGNALFEDNRDRNCPENTQSAQASRVHSESGSLAVLHHETDIEKSSPGGGDQHRLAQTKLPDQFRRDGKREDQSPRN